MFLPHQKNTRSKTDMRSNSIRLLIALSCSFAFGCAKNHPQDQMAAKLNLSPAEMQEAWMRSMTPGENHHVLDPLIGNWKTESTFRGTPDGKPEVTTGKSTARWIYDGRYVEERFEGSMSGHPFQGVGIIGYDNVGRQFQSSWIDSMSTQIFNSSGTYNPLTKQLTMSGNASCPLTSGPKEMKGVLTIEDNDHHTYEMLDKAPDGSEYAVLEIHYTRITDTKKNSKKVTKNKKK